MSITDNPEDPKLTHGVDEAPREQADVYLVLSEAERAQGFIRPLRTSYTHLTCGSTTTMGVAIGETYARKPSFYGSTYCVQCQMHRPVGKDGEFVWDDGSKVGT